jgi:murein DD-endopeptidase MepM/ murein hydrolase activator NlpD
MKTIFNKTIAFFLTFVFISTLFPYWGFAQSRTESLPGSVKGYDRSVFDYHFSKADRELNPERWLSEARRGIGLAINSWEIFSIDLFDSSFEKDDAKRKLEKWSEEELEFRFTQWLINRFFGAEIENITGQLSASVNDTHLRYTYYIDEDGNLLREEKTGDPRIIRPGDEGSDFAADLAKWYEESQKNINDLSGYFETSISAIFPELLAYFTEDLHDSMLSLIGNAASIAFSALQTEFENIVAREQRLFTGRRTGDIYSLRKKSEMEEAGYIVSNLIDQATAVCNAGIAALQSRIEAAAGGEGDLALMGAEWLEMYREQFERGLKIWEEAEERFFIRRVEWEQNSLNLFEQGEETWILAFNRLEEERNNWELQAKKLIESGEEVFKKASKDLEAAITLAKIEILSNLELRMQSGTSKARALVDMYFTCVSAAYAAIENGKFFIEYYDKNSTVDITDDSIYKWIESAERRTWGRIIDRYRSSSVYQRELNDRMRLEIGKMLGTLNQNDKDKLERINTMLALLEKIKDIIAGECTDDEIQEVKNGININEYTDAIVIRYLRSFDTLDEIKKAADMYRSFYAKAIEMRDNLLNDYSNIFTTGALKDILGENVSTEDFVLDEYQIALIKAKVLVNYWEKRTDIANAVQEYATDIGAGRMTEAESLLLWENAKAAYENSIAEYETEMNKLNDIGAEIQDKTNILNDYLKRVNEAEEELNKINNEYFRFIQIVNGKSIEFIKNELMSKYDELLAEYKAVFGKDGNNFYQRELELAAKIELMWKNEERQAVIEYLINGDGEDFPSYNDLKNAWEQILLFDEFDPIPESSVECGINSNDPRGILIDWLIQEMDENYDIIIRELCYAAKTEAYAALKIREMEINMLVDPPDAGNEYGSTEWYNDAWGVVYSGVDLGEHLLDDYEKAFEKLIEKRVLIEIEALTCLLDEEIEANENYSNLLANFCLVNEIDAEYGIIALNILSERITNGENYVNGNDLYENIIAWFISGGSFFSISEIFITEELYDYNLAKGLYNAYWTLNEYSEFISREKWNEFPDIIKQFFGNYGIVTEGTMPKIEDICFTIFNYSGDDEQSYDYVGNAAVFLEGIDKIFLNMPLWLKNEIDEWKIFFINYLAANFYSEVPAMYLVDELIDEAISDYKLIVFFAFKDAREYFEKSTEKEWWRYLDKHDLPDIDVITEGVEGGLIDPKAWADLADLRINYALKMVTDGFHDIENENIEQLEKDYLAEIENAIEHFQKLQKLKIEFEILGEDYELATIPRGILEDELLKYQAKLDNLEIIYQERLNDYFDASSDLAQMAELYDLQYSKTKTVYGNIEYARNEYEKQDAIRRWASTAYLDTDINDLAYCQEKLLKANIVLDILSDLYSDSDEIRPYQNADYEHLYSEYKKSIQEKIIADKAFNSLYADLIQKMNYSDGAYNLFVNAVNNLGKPFLYPDDYISSQDKKEWTIKDIITLKNGKLSFNRNEQFVITGINSVGINEINDYFSVTNINEGQYHGTTAFQEEVKNLGIRMDRYFQDENKMTQWGLARDYLIRQLVTSNKDITFIGGIKIKSAELGSNGSLGRLEYRRMTGIQSNYPKVSDIIEFEKEGLYSLQEGAWVNLSALEKADLEFYIILTLTNGIAYNTGFESFTAVNELQSAYDTVKRFYDSAAERQEWYYLGAYKEMYEVNKFVKDKINETLKNEKNNLLKWKDGIKTDVSKISRYYADYINSCKPINILQTGAFKENGVSWLDIEEILRGLNTLSDEELMILESLWIRMGQTEEDKKYTGIIESITSLANWIGRKRWEDRKALEEQWEKDDIERGKKEHIYYETIEAFLEGKTDENDLQTAMEAAFGDGAAAWRNHFNNMGQAILDTLGEYHLYGPDYKDGFTLLSKEYSELVGTIFGIGLMEELAAREIEWNQQIVDITEKFKTWQDTAKLILAKGREEWNSGVQKMWESYGCWIENFMAEYENVSLLWNEAYLEGLEDKEKWLERAAEVADNALTGAMISVIGSDAEMFSRKMDTRDVIGVSVPNAAFEAENVLANLLNSTGITGMADAFGSVNNLGELSNLTIRRGINRTGIWDDTNARIEAVVLAQEANRVIADGESKKLAASAKEAVKIALEILADNVKSANEGFNSSMDNTFMLQGQWRKNNGKYIKDIVVGSTLFEPLLYERKEVRGYIDYNIGPISLETRLDDEFLEGLESFAIQALIYKVQGEVSVIASSIFGDGERIKFDEERSYGSGKFGEYIGYEPSVRPKPGETKKEIFYDRGKGELGRLLTEYIYWSVIDSRGLAELSLSPWDKRMWDDRDSFFESPTIRSMTDIVLSVGVAVLSLAGTIVTCGAGAGAIIGAAVLIAAINSADDLVFATLDTAFGYKDWTEAGFEFGKALMINTASAVVSGVFSGVSGVTEGFFKGGLNAATANLFSDSVGKVAAQTVMTGVQSVATSTVTNALSNITYTNGSLGYNSDGFKQGMNASWKNTLGSMTSTLVTGTFQGINSGMNMEKLTGFEDATNKKWVQVLNNTIGSVAGQGINFAMGGDFSFNIFNTAIFELMGLKNPNGGNSGLLELHIGRDGTKMNFGTGGADVSLSSIIYSVMGAMVWNVNNQIEKYTNNNEFDAKVALRAQYGFGEKEQKDQLWEILKGKAGVVIGGGDDFKAKTDNIDGMRTITINGYKSGMSAEEQMLLAVILGHEAHRDGIVTSGNNHETRAAVLAHTEMALRMLLDNQQLALDENLVKDIFAYYISNGDTALFYSYVDNNYDSSNDYWKLTYDGRLINDNSGWLTMVDGKPVFNADGKQIGANGIETGLLNIIFGGTSGIRYSEYTEEQIRFAQTLMINAGMNYTEGEDGTIQSRTWGGNAIGQQLDMEQIMRSAGNTVAGSVFARYYEEAAMTYLTSWDNVSIPLNSFSRFYNELLPAIFENNASQGHFLNNPEEYRIIAEHGEIDPNYKYTNYENDAHPGTDITNGKSGGSIFAGISGMVRYAGYGNDPGNYVVMEYGYMFGGSFIGSGVYGEYMHMQNWPNFEINTYLNSNQILGTVGNTGRSDGAHLHYAIYTLQNNSAPQYNAFSSINLRMLLNNNMAQTVSSREAKYYVGTHSYPATKVTYNIEYYLNYLNRR